MRVLEKPLFTNRYITEVAYFDDDVCVERHGQLEDIPLLLGQKVKTLEELTGGLFAGFSRSWTFSVDLSHKVIENLVDIDLALG